MRQFAKRFWSKVDRHGPTMAHMQTPCWQWTAGLAVRGYGKIKLGGRTDLAHRVAWRLVIGQSPSHWVLHRCDNRKCVRPSHLFEGTAVDNAQDMIAKGRKADTRGELHGGAKLTADTVREIRSIYAAGICSQQALAEHFGVVQSHIGNIISGLKWSHI